MLDLYQSRSAVVGVVGLGYVGMPLVLAALAAGFKVIGFDIDPAKVESLAAGRSYLAHISDQQVSAPVREGRFRPTGDFSEAAEADAIIICVPTPLTAQREPDLSFVTSTCESIAPHLRKGHLVVLESTTWPGTTDEVMRPILERRGLRSGKDFFLAFSPEREDPGNAAFPTRSIPKVVGADDKMARDLALALYGAIVERTVPVSSSRTAEAVKLTENIFRAVNIALVNELKIVYDRMGIDVWEVIEAAKSKPFGYMPFYPGPGLGGHCIPVDPFYLTWKAREHEVATKFIELAGEINTAMPAHVIERLALALDERFGRGLRGARILILGVAYKRNVADIRESPALKLMQLLERRGAAVDYHDPHVAEIPATRDYAELKGRRSAAWEPAGYDAVLIATDHDAVDYSALAAAKLVVDTRNACARAGLGGPNIVKA